MMKNLKKRLKDQRGLTLIELLAVIVILGIIAAIAIPSIGGIIGKTKKDAKVAEGIQIINAAKMYTSVHSVSNGDTLVNSATSSVLGDYLDNLKDNTFTVTISVGTDGKYTYTLTDHDSVALVDKNNDSKASEQELLDY